MTKALKKIPFSFWFFAFALIMLVTSLVNLPNAAGADEADITRYSRNRVGLNQAIVRYHQDMNALVNDHLKKMFAGGRYVVEPPEDKACGDQHNISTYCLSVRMVDKYDAFVQAMGTHRGFLQDKGADGRQSVDELTGQFNQRLALINEQIVLAEKIMSVTLATYDQVQVFYPLHVQYQDLIKELERYRDGLADVRKEVEKYPGKFHDVTTTECT